MGYREDAYNQLGTIGEPVGRRDNAAFLWPGNKIRHIEAEKLIDGDPTTAYTRQYELKRGYIRGLPQPGVHKANFQPLKCNFQFNPQTIVQTVTMREDVYLPIMQDPVAFTQPFAGSVNLNVASRNIELHWASTDYVMERGGVL